MSDVIVENELIVLSELYFLVLFIEEFRFKRGKVYLCDVG